MSAAGVVAIVLATLGVIILVGGGLMWFLNLLASLYRD